MKKISVLLVSSLIVFGMSTLAQTDGGVSIGKGNNPANAKSILELVSKTKGLLIPRMTDTERNAIFSGTDLTAKGLMVFDDTQDAFYFWDGTAWKPVASGNMQTVAGTPTIPGVTGDLTLDTQNSLLYIFSGGKWVKVSGSNTILDPKWEGRTLQLGSQDGKAVSVSMDDLLKTIPASDVKVTPNTTLGLSSDNVQDALMELQGEIKTASGGGMNSVVHDGSLAGNGTAGFELKVAPGGIAGSHLAAGAVTTPGLADGAVTTPKLAVGAVTSANLAADAVTTAKIAEGAVTASKIMGGGKDKVLTTNVYGTTEWVDKSSVSEIGGISAVVHDKTLAGIGTLPLPLGLAINSVTTNEIVNKTIKAEDLDDMSAQDGYFLKFEGGTGWAAREVFYDPTITGNGTAASPLGLADNAVTSAKIADGSVSSTKITDGAVTSTKLADKAVSAANLSQMGAISGQVLLWDGTTWKPGTAYEGTGGGASVNVDPAFFTGNGTTLPLGLKDGAVTSTKIAAGTIKASNLSAMGATASGQVLQWDGSAWAATTPLVTGADKTKLDAITGTNTGDETTTSILDKLGATAVTGNNTGDQTLSLAGNSLTISGTGGNTVDLSAIGGSDITGIIAGTGLTGGGTTGDVTLGLTPVTNNSILGNNTGSAAAPSPLTGAQVKTILALTKADVGLGDVENTKDLDKPVSTATQTALDGKVDENAAITGGTATKITYDSKGLVTGGENPTTLAGYGITDAAASTHAHAAGDLTDVTIASETINDILQWNGSAWVNKKPANLGLTGTDVGLGLVKNVDQTDAGNLTSGTIDPDRFGIATIPVSSLITTGTADGTTFLRGDGTWGVPTGGSGSATDLSATTTATTMTINSSTGTSTAVIPIGSTTSAGLITAADKIKLNGISGSNTGDVTLSGSGQNYLTLSGQTLTAGAVNLSGTHVTGTLAAARFPALTGDVTTTAGSLTTTLSPVGMAGTYRSVTTDAKGRVTSGTNPTKLEDYGITGTADGNVLQWDNTSSKWLNTAPSALGLTKNDIGLGNVQNVDQTNAANLTSGTISAARFPALTGDVTTSAGSLATTLSPVGMAGTYRSVTTDAKGRVTSGTNPTKLEDYGITGTADGDILQWDASTSKWINTQITPGNETITFTPTGDVTGSTTGTTSLTPALTIGDGKVTNAKLASGIDAAKVTVGVLPLTSIPTTLTGITSLNGLALTPLATGFSISGGTTPRTLTLADHATVSGTNTGDQTITLTGNVTGSGTGTFAATIANDAVTSAKIANGTIVGDDLNQMSATSGQVLQWNGVKWLPSTVTAGGDADADPLNEIELPDYAAAGNEGKILAVKADRTDVEWVAPNTGALASIAPATILGNNTGAAAAPAALDALAVKTMLALDQVQNVDQTDATNLTSGTIAAARFGSATIPVAAISATGTTDNTTYLRGDGTWGTVTATLPIASDTELGGIKVGSNMDITVAGVLTAKAHSHALDALSNVSITGPHDNHILQWNGISWVNKSVTAAIPEATTSGSGLLSMDDKIKLASIEAGANNYTYTLPVATSTTLGGIKVGERLKMEDGVLSATGTGTVTNVSVVGANGITGNVVNPGTEPAISLSLGSITPSAITITGGGNISTDGNISGANITGNVAASNITGILPILKGGTGASDAATARDNLGLGNIDNTSDVAKPISGATQLALNTINTALSNKIDISQKGATDGVVPLNASKKIDEIYLPASLVGGVSFMGAYDAAGDVPLLPAPSTDNTGFYYIISVPGTVTAIKSGGSDFPVSEGDWLLSDGSEWSKISGGSGVTSIFNRSDAMIYAEVGDYNTNQVPELTTGATNLYFTNTRVDTRISSTWLSNDETLADLSESQFPTEKAVKTYVDAKVPVFNALDKNKVLTVNDAGAAVVWAESAGSTPISLSGDVIGSEVGGNIITSITSEAVGTTELAADAVTSAKINNGTIVGDDISAGAISATKIKGISANGAAGQVLASDGVDGFAWKNGGTDLSKEVSATSMTIKSSTGTGTAVIPIGSSVDAGLMTAADKQKLDKMADIPIPAVNGQVLTVNSLNGKAEWITPAVSGAGGAPEIYSFGTDFSVVAKGYGPHVTCVFTPDGIDGFPGFIITIPQGGVLENLQLIVNNRDILVLLAAGGRILDLKIIDEDKKVNTSFANMYVPTITNVMLSSLPADGTSGGIYQVNLAITNGNTTIPYIGNGEIIIEMVGYAALQDGIGATGMGPGFSVILNY